MGQTHHDAVLGLCGDLQDRLVHGGPHGGQRVVAGGGERRGDALEHGVLAVADQGRLAVHEGLRVRHGRAERLRDGLVPQAHPEERAAAVGGGADEVEGDTGVGGCARPGRDEHGRVLGRELEGAGGGDLVVADHGGAGPELLEVAHQGVDEAVVVVDDEDGDLGALHGALFPPRRVGAGCIDWPGTSLTPVLGRSAGYRPRPGLRRWGRPSPPPEEKTRGSTRRQAQGLGPSEARGARGRAPQPLRRADGPRGRGPGSEALSPGTRS